jgi:tRNA threonylcarbamoyladenosine modification (KEOPS) complex Cgi121 subunit
VSQLQVLAAVNRALNDEHYGILRTKHLHSEIVYALAATQNVYSIYRVTDTQISEAFKTVGLNDSSKEIIVVKVTSARVDEVRLPVDKLTQGFEARSAAGGRQGGVF